MNDKPPLKSQETPEIAAEIPHARFNYWSLAIEGGLFAGGVTFVNATTLLPTIVQSLGCPVWLISLMPVMMMIGFRLPPIFTAHFIEAMPRYRPFLLATGLIQRLPYGVAALLLILMPNATTAALVTVSLAPLISGFFGGVSVAAWQQLLSNCVPTRRRHSLFAIRAGIACVLGVVIGKAVEEVLSRWPGITGYGVLHLCAFILAMGSFFIFTLVREPRTQAVSPVQSSPGMLANFRLLPGLLAGDRNFSFLLVSRFFRNGLGILMPFLAIQCQIVTQAPTSFLGQLVIVQMFGAVAGNVLAAFLGGRFGGKCVYLLGSAILVGMALWATVARTPLEWQAIFFIFGLGFFSSEVSNNTLGLEMGPVGKRATYLSLAALINFPGMLLASWISAMLWQPGHHFVGLALLAAISALMSMAFILPVHESHDHKSPENLEEPEIGTV